MLKLRRRLRAEMAAVRGMTSSVARYASAEWNLRRATQAGAAHKGKAHRQMLEHAANAQAAQAAEA
jgi:hypothetical protein